MPDQVLSDPDLFDPDLSNPDMLRAFLLWCGDQPATFWWGVAALVVSTLFLFWADRLRAEAVTNIKKGEEVVARLHRSRIVLEEKIKEARRECERLEATRGGKN